MINTTHVRICRSKADNASEWKSLVYDKGEGLIGHPPEIRNVLATLIHLSDLHICDSQSPGRLEFLDRFADPDHPLAAVVGYIGTYRAQEFLTTQVLEAMVESVNKITVGPLAGSKINAVVVTGDVVDNAQLNELAWYKSLLDGGPISPKSGDPYRSQGVHSSDSDTYDIHYYHPDGPPVGQVMDRPSTLYGYPTFEGVVAAAERPFIAQGLRHHWYAVHGNHDGLSNGVAAPSSDLESLKTGSRKLIGLGKDFNFGELLTNFGEVGPVQYPRVDQLETILTTADERRKLVAIEDWVRVHVECGHDHGMRANENQVPFWFRDISSSVRLVGLDTVNRFGGWQGCIHREQFIWLKNVLLNSRDKYVVISSHHPLMDLYNEYVPDGELKPALSNEIREMLLEFPNVILWMAGHTHEHKITGVAHLDGSHGFWEIQTASHIDWPQQGRTIEIVRTKGGKIAIGTIVVDHAGPVEFSGSENELSNPIALAGFSRLLSANDWQRQGGKFDVALAEGTPKDRNAWLWADDPFIHQA